jgi:hypothetical protein
VLHAPGPIRAGAAVRVAIDLGRCTVLDAGAGV